MTDNKEQKSAEKNNCFDTSDSCFTKAVSILIAVAYSVTILVNGRPFSVSSALSKYTIFSQTNEYIHLNVIKYLFIANMVLIIVLEIFSIVFLAKGKAKGSAMCEIASSWSGLITFAYYVAAVLRFSLKPTNKGFSFVMYVVAALWFLICGIVYIVKLIKNRVKIKAVYCLPAILVAIAVLGIFAIQTRLVTFKSGFENYSKDEFEYDPDALVQADNYLRGAVSVNDEIYCVHKLSDDEYGLVKIGPDGSMEILDSAAFIAEYNLVINGDYIYYLKYPGFWEDVYIAPSKNAQNSSFKLSAINIKTGEIRESYSDSFVDGLGKNLFNSVLIGMRDDKLFLLTRCVNNHSHFEIYTIVVKDNIPDPSRVERYAWDLNLVTVISSAKDYPEPLYNGLIVSYDYFYYLNFDGVSYKHQYMENLQGMVLTQHPSGYYDWAASYTRCHSRVIDYNVYNGKLYFARINYDERTYDIVTGELNDDETVIASIPFDEFDYFTSNPRIIVSDTYIIAMAESEYRIIPL